MTDVNRRGKAIAISTAVLGVVVLVAAGLAAKDRIREEWYLHKLKTGEQNEREVAAEVLGELKCNRAVPLLVELLRDESTARNLLEPLTGKRRHLKIHYAAGSLEKIGAPAVASLANCLDHPNPLVRVQAANVLLKMGRETCGPIFAKAQALMESDQILDEISARMDSEL
ncbi:MAG: hypothetical protein HY721_08310 [Planctomycetes bacterium]|nr:hypothetical protein [Planctomycetota bacterium]